MTQKGFLTTSHLRDRQTIFPLLRGWVGCRDDTEKEVSVEGSQEESYE